MLKKLSLLGVACLLAACGSSIASKEPKFKISNEQFQSVLLTQNNVEQCIYPQLSGLSYDDAKHIVYDQLSEAEEVVLSRYTNDILRSTIGDVQYGIFLADEASQNYLSEMHKKYNHQFATGIDYQECEVIKARFYNEVQNFRGQ